MPANTEASPLRTIVGDENVLVLAPRPGDEVRFCGGLIAEACARGRPPFVAILTDGSSTGSAATPAGRAAAHERAAREAVAALGLPAARLLLVGLYDHTVPTGGPAFEMLVKAVALIMWARDCNVICVPWDDVEQDRAATRRVAEAVAGHSGVDLVYAGLRQLRLDTGAHRPAIGAAAERYTAAPEPDEFYGRAEVEPRSSAGG